MYLTFGHDISDGDNFNLILRILGWINDLTGSYDTSFYIAGSLCLGPAIPFIVTQLVVHHRKSRKHSLKVHYDQEIITSVQRSL